MERLSSIGQSKRINSLADLKVGDEFEWKDDEDIRTFTLLSKHVRNEGQGTVRIVRTNWKRIHFHNDDTKPTESIVDKLWFKTGFSNRYLTKI